MKKRFLAFLLAVCVAVSMLVLPASAVGSNAAVQTATALGGLTAEQAGSLGAPDRKSTRLNSSHSRKSRMPSSA